ERHPCEAQLHRPGEHVAGHARGVGGSSHRPARGRKLSYCRSRSAKACSSFSQSRGSTHFLRGTAFARATVKHTRVAGGASGRSMTLMGGFFSGDDTARGSRFARASTVPTGDGTGDGDAQSESAFAPAILFEFAFHSTLPTEECKRLGTKRTT